MERVMRPVGIDGIFAPVVDARLRKAGVRNTTFRVLAHDNDREARTSYWWKQKLLGGSSELESVLSNGNRLVVQTEVWEHQLPQVGVVVFGCSATPRFNEDREALHQIVDHLLKVGYRDTYTVMVVCFRSPIDEEPAHPLESGRRTSEGGRTVRTRAISDALGLDTLGPRIVHEVVLVETLADTDLTAPLRKLADYEARAVSPKRRHEDAGSDSVTGSDRRVKPRTIVESSRPQPPPRNPLSDLQRELRHRRKCFALGIQPVRSRQQPLSRDKQTLANGAEEERKRRLAAYLDEQEREVEELRRLSMVVCAKALGRAGGDEDGKR